MSPRVRPDQAVVLGRAEDRWLEQARARLLRRRRPATATASNASTDREESR